MKKAKVTLTIQGTTDQEIADIAQSLQVFAEKITASNIILLGTKAKKKGINSKIQKFQNYI